MSGRAYPACARRLPRVCRNRPAPVSSTSASATCPITRPRRTLRPPAALAAICFSACAGWARLACERRPDPEQETGGRRNPQGKQEHPPIRLRIQGYGLGQEGQQRAGHERGYQQPTHCPGEGEQCGLQRQLAGDAAARRAQRGPHRQLLPAGKSAGKEQAGHVQAGEQQHQPGRAEQDEQRPLEQHALIGLGRSRPVERPPFRRGNAAASARPRAANSRAG